MAFTRSLIVSYDAGTFFPIPYKQNSIYYIWIYLTLYPLIKINAAHFYHPPTLPPVKHPTDEKYYARCTFPKCMFFRLLDFLFRSQFSTSLYLLCDLMGVMLCAHSFFTSYRMCFKQPHQVVGGAQKVLILTSRFLFQHCVCVCGVCARALKRLFHHIMGFWSFSCACRRVRLLVVQHAKCDLRQSSKKVLSNKSNNLK